MGNRLAGKVAVVTGAGRNIGRAEALALAGEGASILVNDVFEPEATAELIRAHGGTAVANSESASSWQGGEAIIAAAIAAFGRIDILINNAGVARPVPIERMSEADWDAVVDVSLKAYAATIRFAAPHFIAQHGGIIVNTGSTSGLGHMHMTNYSAAKEGTAGLTRSVAKDLGQYGVRCNMIRPVSHITTMIGPEMMFSFEESMRLGFPVNGHFNMRSNGTPSPEHVAAMALLLCLPATAHISGREFSIQGEEMGRFQGPDLIRSQYHPGGWTIEAMEDPIVLDNLLGGIANDYVRAG